MSNCGSITTIITILDCDFEVSFDYEMTHKGCAARIHDIPERNYPAEDAEYKITITMLRKFLPDDLKGKYVTVPDWLEDLIIEYLHESDKVNELIRTDQEESSAW